MFKHWACILLNDKTKEIQFFDPSANDEIRQGILPIIELLKTVDDKYKYYVTNKVNVQIDKHNCGIFSIDFIVNIMKGQSFDKYIHKLVKKRKVMGDEAYNIYSFKLREVYFI